MVNWALQAVWTNLKKAGTLENLNQQLFEGINLMPCKKALIVTDEVY